MRSPLTSMFMLCALVALSHARPAQAQEVRLSEVVPALAGSALGGLAIESAEGTGGVRVVRRSDVLRALAAAGASAEGLDIPARSRVARGRTVVPAAELLAEASVALAEAAAPCELAGVELPTEIVLDAGPRELHAELPKALRSGAARATLVIEGGKRPLRVAVSIELACPAPAVLAGQQVRLVAVVGSVTASAPGEAKQPGRIGDVIRVRNRATDALLSARIVDSQTVEVVP